MTIKAKKRVLIISRDTIDDKMAGLGIRYWEMASLLARHGHPITLAIPNKASIQADFPVVQTGWRNIAPLISRHDIIICFLHKPYTMPSLLWGGKWVILDFYNLFVFEVLHNLSQVVNYKKASSIHRKELAMNLAVADMIACSNERQRDFLIGLLFGGDKVTPELYGQDPSLRSLVAVVPHGIPAEVPKKGANRLRGILPGVSEKDFLLLWAGGLWNWSDPLSLIRAMALIKESHPTIKLVFLGTTHPNPIIGEPDMARRAFQLSEELGLAGRTIFFLEGWSPYSERHDYFLEADLSVSVFPNSCETTYATRTRFFDCLWTGLPVLTTEGDWAAQEVSRKELGLVVSCCDPSAIARAVVRSAEDEGLRKEWRQNISCLREDYRWEKVLEPIVRFCEDPRHVRKPAWPKLLPSIGRLYLEKLFSREYLKAARIKLMGTQAPG
ncbi:MAG: glycosyltransferase family 4 protein [Armatimonadetes bacterium]|nr:glycosyltransferase family 4 protein [Armatimonadota bacterium]